jgi:LPS sulfotransferase NodH
MYPDAKFVHIVRDPRKIFPSTMKLWKSLDSVQALQAGEYEARLKPFVLNSLTTMYKSFERDRIGMSNDQLIDVHYEDLVKDPVNVVRQIYEQLGLPNFDSIEPLVQNKKQQDKEYKTNRFGVDTAEEAEIMTAWKGYATQYGYA